MSADLIVFLRAQLDEDGTNAGDIHDELACRTYGPLPMPCNCGYPARVLREVEAKRAILAAYEANDSDVPLHLSSDTRKHGEWDGLRLAVRHLAAIYSDRPGYRREWGP